MTSSLATATATASAATAAALPRCEPLEREWIDRLDAAHTEIGLLLVVRSFVSSWHPEALALIPQEARPLRVSSREEIAVWAYELARARLRASIPHDVDEWVSRMQVFFSQAASRAAMLAATSSKV